MAAQLGTSFDLWHAERNIDTSKLQPLPEGQLRADYQL